MLLYYNNVFSNYSSCRILGSIQVKRKNRFGMHINKSQVTSSLIAICVFKNEKKTLLLNHNINFQNFVSARLTQSQNPTNGLKIFYLKIIIMHHISF